MRSVCREEGTLFPRPLPFGAAGRGGLCVKVVKAHTNEADTQTLRHVRKRLPASESVSECLRARARQRHHTHLQAHNLQESLVVGAETDFAPNSRRYLVRSAWQMQSNVAPPVWTLPASVSWRTQVREHDYRQHPDRLSGAHFKKPAWVLATPKDGATHVESAESKMRQNQP